MIKKESYPSPLENAYLNLRKKLDTLGSNFNLPKADTEDLIQESYLRLVDRNIDRNKEAEGKLWMTMRNLSVDWFRRNKKKSQLYDNNFEESSYEDYNNLDYDILRAQMKSLLSPTQYRIMTMHVVEELDYPEIADALDMTEGAVRTNVSRARKILKEKMKL